MTKEEAYNSALFAYIVHHAYLAAVAQELGMEHARAFATPTLEKLGARQGQMLKQQAGVEQADAAMACQLLDKVISATGVTSEIVELSPEKAVIRGGRCPIYEGARAVGFDHATCEHLCRTGALHFLDAAAKQLNPNLTYRLQAYRSGPEDSCIEEIVMG